MSKSARDKKKARRGRQFWFAVVSKSKKRRDRIVAEMLTIHLHQLHTAARTREVFQHMLREQMIYGSSKVQHKFIHT